MGQYTFYDQETGGVVSHLSGALRTAKAKQQATGQCFIEGGWDGEKYRIVDGKPSLIPQAEIDAKNTADATSEMRQRRDGALQESDWTQIPDAPLTEAQKTEWQTYRQQLRDLPANTEDPRNVAWPTKPSS